MNKQHIPYTYTVHCIPTGQFYYGVQYGNHAHPDNKDKITLWSPDNTIKRCIHPEDQRFKELLEQGYYSKNGKYGKRSSQ